MKKILYILLPFLLLCFFQSCDVIGENDRLIEMEHVEAKKGVLLIDFTDQRCVNCPNAAEIIHDLKEIHGEALVTVSMHASQSTLPLVTADGNAYESYFEIDKLGHPTAVIDGGAPSIDRLSWGGIVLEQLKQDPSVAIELASSYDAESREVTILSTLTGLNSSSSFQYQLWLTEDGIVDFQQIHSGFDMEYVHNHVFRAAVNGLWGENVPLEANQEKTLTHTFTLENNWVPDNMHIVAFMFENNSKKVHQAIEIKLTN